MAKEVVNNVKLGVFVIAGMVFLILLLYMIGKDQTLFRNTFTLKARFENTQGLMQGNNVRFSGIEIGTVKKIRILSDTLIEVEMIIEEEMKKFIRKNAVVSIGSDGLMGNRLINISPLKEPAPLVIEGDILMSRKSLDTDEMLRVLNKTNNDMAVIAENLKSTILRLNNSSAVWQLLNDSSLPVNAQSSMANIRLATEQAKETVRQIQMIVSNVKEGNGSLGVLLKDTSLAQELNETIAKVKLVSNNADSFVLHLNAIAESIQNDLNSGKGTASAILKDSTLIIKLNNSLDNIEMGTAAFNENMKALKNNFLLRGYFRKQQKLSNVNKYSSIKNND